MYLSKKTLALLAGIATGIFIWAFTPVQISGEEELEIGEKAPHPEVELKDVSGEMLTLKSVLGEKGLLVIFSCNTCPWVAKWEDRYNPIAELAKDKGIGTIALNPNAGYRDSGDSFTDMKKRAEKSNYRFYYAFDKEAKMAKAFGANRTPHVFLFNEELQLVYKGAIDDNPDSAENVSKPYLKNAISALALGEKISPRSTRSLGCSIQFSNEY